MSNSDDNIRRNIEVLKILEKAIELGPWDESLFLRATGDKLRKLRDQFMTHANFKLEESTSNEELLRETSEELSEQQLVFISLYNSAGSEIRNWERLLNNLGAVLITRPVYANESDAKELIRSKANKKNEAYISVYVNRSGIMPPIGGIVPKDALAHELLVLKEGTVKPENIVRFVHISGEYKFLNGRLKRIG